jgi:hypothetical protein
MVRKSEIAASPIAAPSIAASSATMRAAKSAALDERAASQLAAIARERRVAAQLKISADPDLAEHGAAMERYFTLAPDEVPLERVLGIEVYGGKPWWELEPKAQDERLIRSLWAQDERLHPDVAPTRRAKQLERDLAKLRGEHRKLKWRTIYELCKPGVAHLQPCACNSCRFSSDTNGER